MQAKSTRLIVMIAVLAIDFGLLAGVTYYLFHGSSESKASASVPLTSTLVASSSASGSAPQVQITLPPTPKSAVDHLTPISGSPKYIVSGTSDRQGGVWLGTEGAGIWSYRQGKLQQYSVAQGLPEDGVCAVACDAMGRIWAGHEAHGVSIFNGQTWQNYGRFDGPGGSHIFAITTSPVDGDVWLATENGIARYSLKGDAWSHFDRSNGLPAAEVEAIAIDHAGDVFAALPDSGIACARAADGFARWSVTTGPDDVPATGDGAGLPGPIVNALLVTKSDVLYAGTTRGLARSTDRGATWSFVQGSNWAQLLGGSYGGTPAGFQTPPASPLMEDWITALAEDASGALWIGYRGAGFQLISGNDSFPVRVAKGKISVVVPLGNHGCVLGSVGDGASQCGTDDNAAQAAAQQSFPSALAADAFPSIAKPITADVLDALRKKVEALAPAADGVEYLTDDWETIGDWPGRYGTSAVHLAAGGPIHQTDGCDIAVTTGPYRAQSFQLNNSSRKDTAAERALFDPTSNSRNYLDVNDGSTQQAQHPLWEEGPDLFLRVDVPAGVHRVSLYFCNYDGHQGFNEWRQYPLQVRRADGSGPAGSVVTDNPILEGKNPNFNGAWLDSSEAIEPELAPIMARTYVPRYWYGVYKQFLIRGAGRYWIKVVRNYSVGCKIEGAFIDRLDAPIPAVTDAGPAWPTPPAVPNLSGANATVQSAAQLWQALDAAVGREGYASVNEAYRTLAYQAAADNQADSALLANWRFELQSWSAADRGEFNKVFKITATH